MNVVNENLAEEFYEYLALERSMAQNSIDAYRQDIAKLLYY
ncbi:MAG: site-specific integrase, partial [Bacteroidales bacterium]|nr:site-specific integrase [Bacteroidales bacterium]